MIKRFSKSNEMRGEEVQTMSQEENKARRKQKNKARGVYVRLFEKSLSKKLEESVNAMRQDFLNRLEYLLDKQETFPHEEIKKNIEQIVDKFDGRYVNCWVADDPDYDATFVKIPKSFVNLVSCSQKSLLEQYEDELKK